MPVDIQFGPGGDLFYVDVWGGAIKRIHYTDGNQAPKAVASASATHGATPLVVTFDGSGSSDPDTGDSISYAWDLDGDGEFDDASTAQAAYAYPLAGTYNAGLRVTDSHGATATDFVGITAGDTPPTATIVSPTTGFTWKVGDPIDFVGSGTDAQDGDLPAERDELVARARPLPERLPRACAPDLQRSGSRHLPRPGPRVSRPTSSCDSPSVTAAA